LSAVGASINRDRQLEWRCRFRSSNILGRVNQSANHKSRNGNIQWFTHGAVKTLVEEVPVGNGVQRRNESSRLLLGPNI
jgi:hypothetical protein